MQLEKAGVTVIAPTRRADGTWRKARRVREGYVPPDEVAAYQAAPARVRRLAAARLCFWALCYAHVHVGVGCMSTLGVVVHVRGVVFLQPHKPHPQAWYEQPPHRCAPSGLWRGQWELHLALYAGVGPRARQPARRRRRLVCR